MLESILLVAFSFGEVADVATVVIAVCALVLSVFELRQSRKDTRLSCAPLLSVQCIFRRKEPFAVRFRNSGIGPARIRGIRFVVLGEDGRKSSHPGDLVGIDEAVTQLGIDRLIVTRVALGPQDFIAVGDYKTVLELDTVPLSDDARIEILARLGRLDVEIEFESLYGDPGSAQFSGLRDVPKPNNVRGDVPSAVENGN